MINLIVGIFLSFISYVTQPMVEPDSIFVYEKFYRAGNTVLLRDVFNAPLDYKISDIMIQVDPSDKKILGELIKSAQVKKHRQMKMIVDLAMVVYYNNQPYWFVITNQNTIIDLTSQKKYILKRANDKQLLKEFVVKYSVKQD